MSFVRTRGSVLTTDPFRLNASPATSSNRRSSRCCMISRIVSSPSPMATRSNLSTNGSTSPEGYGPPTTVSAFPRTSAASEKASSCMVIMQ